MKRSAIAISFLVVISVFFSSSVYSAGPLSGFWELNFSDGSKLAWTIKEDNNNKHPYYYGLLYYKGEEVAMQVIAGNVGSDINTRSSCFGWVNNKCTYERIYAKFVTPTIIQGNLVLTGNVQIPKEKTYFTGYKK